MLLRPSRLGALVTAAALLLSPAVAAATPTPEEEATDAELLLMLDASGSMADPDAQGEPKIEAARTALHEVIDGLDPSQSVGLRVFGGSVPRDQPREDKCTDSELVVPIGSGNADALSSAVDDYAPLGETPIAYALQQAGDDLADEGERTIVLVSDGIATCDPDPCEVAEQLRADGLDLVIHTVGLGADEQTRTQLQCVAEAGGGSYFDATDAETLTTALVRLSTRAFRPFVYSGSPVTGTPQAQGAPELASGQYTDTVADRERAKKHYAIPRTAPGSRILVGATMKNPGPSGVSGLGLSLATPEGRQCTLTTMPVFSAGMQSSFGTAGGGSPAAASDECNQAETLILSLEPQAGSQQVLGEPVEIVVEELAPVTNEDALPEASDVPQWSGLAPGQPAGEVVGGVSPSAATPVEAGQTVSFDLVPGEIAFFSVPVGYGQGLEALVEFPGVEGPLAQDMGPASDVIDMALIAPYRAQVHDVLADTPDSARAPLEPGTAARAAVVMPEVRWANDAAKAPTLAGDHVVMVSLSSSRERLVPIPLTLTTNVVGEVSGVPEHGAPETDAATETAAPDTSSATTEPVEATEEPAAAGPADDDEGGTSWLPWVLGGAGVLVAAAGAVVIGLRRS